MGTSLNQFLRDQIKRLAGMQQRMTEHDAFEASCLHNGARLEGRKFKRDEAKVSFLQSTMLLEVS